MDIDHPDSKGSSRGNRFGNGIRDVMKFEIEKDIKAHSDDFLHKRGTSAGKQLLADLDATKRRTEELQQGSRLFCGGKIERYDDALGNLRVVMVSLFHFF